MHLMLPNLPPPPPSFPSSLLTVAHDNYRSSSAGSLGNCSETAMKICIILCHTLSLRNELNLNCFKFCWKSRIFKRQFTKKWIWSFFSVNFPDWRYGKEHNFLGIFVVVCPGKPAQLDSYRNHISNCYISPAVSGFSGHTTIETESWAEIHAEIPGVYKKYS